MGVRQLYWIAQRICSSVSKSPMAIQDVIMAIPCRHCMDFWLAAFITEGRKADGGYYSPASLNYILAGLFRHMKDKFEANTPNFLSKAEANFSVFRNALDRQLRFLRGSGVGVELKHASIITAEDEDKLWKSGVLGIDNPVALLKRCVLPKW